jgi:hypothetical protein
MKTQLQIINIIIIIIIITSHSTENKYSTYTDL